MGDMEPELIQPEKLAAAATEAELEEIIRMGGDVSWQAHQEVLRRARYEAFLEERRSMLDAHASCDVAANKFK
jgi:hypothetical protein